VRSQFQAFLSLSGHQLEQRPFPDVVQLALSQPHASEVYRQALLQARRRAGTGELYFDWLYGASASFDTFLRRVLNREVILKQ